MVFILLEFFLLKSNTLIFLLLLTIFSVRLVQATPNYLIVGDPWPPWVDGQYGDNAHGIAADIINEIFLRLNKTIEMKLYPWKRVLKMAEYGIADGVIIIQPDNESYPFLSFTTPVFTSSDILCFNKNHFKKFKWQKSKDLKAYRIGTIIGYSYGDFSQEAARFGLKLEPVKNLKINIEKLVRNRIDFIICDKRAIQEKFKLNPTLKQNIGIAKKTVQNWSYSLGISKSSPLNSDIKKINRIISQILREKIQGKKDF